MRKAAAAAIADADEAVKRRRRDEKTTAVVVAAKSLVVTNDMIRDWIKRQRDLCETNAKEPHSDFGLLLIHLNEEIKEYAGASAAEDILIPDDYVPCLFAYSSVDQLAKLVFNLDGQYYHDCSTGLSSARRAVGKSIRVIHGNIACSHLRYKNFGRNGLWGPLVDYGFRQLSDARHAARGKVLLEASFEYKIDGLAPDIVAIVQSFFPASAAEPGAWTSVDAGIHGAIRVPMRVPLPDVKDQFFANGDLDARVRARIPWCWNHDNFALGNLGDDDGGYPVSPDDDNGGYPVSPSYNPTSPNYGPYDSPVYDPVSPSYNERNVATGWESTTVVNDVD